jgi:hypothetical protein
MTMELWGENYIFTTGIVAVQSNTLLSQNILDRNENTQYLSFGYGTTTATVITVSFSSACVVDKIFLKNHNLKQFRIFYDGVTANTFTPNITYTTNSESTQVFTINSVTVSSISLQCDLATAADTEKAIGEFYIGQKLISFERNPTAKSYLPVLNRTQVIHTMPNGGVTRFIVDEKMKITMSWEYLTPTFYGQLQTIFNDGSPMYFVPFPTTTAWGGQAWEVLWTNPFEFDFSSDNKLAGYGGKMVLEETA